MTAVTEFPGIDQSDADVTAAALARARVTVAAARAERAGRQARIAREVRAQRLRDIGWTDQAHDVLTDEAAVADHAAVLRREGE